jgi:hypothetical protein
MFALRYSLMLKSRFPAMQAASRFIANLSHLRDSCDSGDIVCAAWSRAVGKKVAAHSRAAKLVRDRLVVEVEDWLWQRNLMGLSRQILKNLEQALGPGIVADIEFRIMPPRRGPLLAEASTPGFAVDEADSIADPVLRRIYRSKRRKELA